MHESTVEDAAIDRFAQECRIGSALDDAIERSNLSSGVLPGRIRAAPRKLNHHLPDATLDAVVAVTTQQGEA